MSFYELPPPNNDWLLSLMCFLLVVLMVLDAVRWVQGA